MGRIYKGTIAAIDGNMARVVPSDAADMPTAKLVIPWHLRGSAGQLQKGTEVIYAEFDDATGILLCRADGEWGEYLPALLVAGVDVENHRHGITDGSNITGKPQ